ncbi:sulfurtransferase complex subunit TusB [Candidatus Williamhamiltonella defendens]|uniref:sulfurtransferase complex subunit TusB n=1 Tax=Candidatus Williamhamiltonella defendens TaxID=138072 RepID=UPI00130D8B46|nr:sulfurtransferase complex subunit TusB [Candidatus Hamiltonella defensa]
MLYTLSRSPYRVDCFAFSRFLSKEDDLLFMQDGVVALLNKSYFLKCHELTNVFILEEDMMARGLQFFMPKEAKRINYQDFVQLTIKHKQHIAW